MKFGKMTKLNDGNGAVVCDICGKIIRQGTSDFAVDICNDCQKQPPVIDNFDLITDIMDFDYPEDTFYWIQILKRKKDNPEMKHDCICYKSYYFYNVEELLKAKEEIIKLCKTFNARAVMWVNPRRLTELSLPVAQMALEYTQSNQFKALPKVFDHVCGKHYQKNTPQLYIVDVDSKNVEYLNKVLNIVKTCANPSQDFEIRKILPTLHGYHIICNGFNLHQFEQLCIIECVGNIDVHKDNPTVLYFCPQ